MTASVDIFKILRKLGVLPEKWKGKKFAQLSAAQRGYVTKLTAEFKSIILHPSQFVIRRVKPDTEKALKKQGFKTRNGKAFIKSDFDGQVKISTTKTKAGIRTRVQIINGFETKTIYPITIQELVIKGVPGWVRALESKFTSLDTWGVSIAGKLIENAYGSIDQLLARFEEYLETTIKGDARFAYLMHIKQKKTLIRSSDIKSRSAQIKDADSTAKKAGKWRK